MYIGYLLTQDTAYLRQARQWFRDILLYSCSTSAHNLDAINYTTGDSVCKIGAYPDGFPGSVSKNTGWLMAMGSFATLFESLLGGQALNTPPQIGSVIGLPLIGNQGAIEIQVTDSDNDVKEVRLEWLSKANTHADESLQHLICFDDGGAQSTETKIGPVYNARTQGNSGDQIADNNIYTCTIQAADNLSETDLSDIRIVAIDQNAQRAFKRIRPTAAAIPHDVNGDGLVNIADVIAIINAILNNEDATTATDCTGNNILDIADVICEINIILQQ